MERSAVRADCALTTALATRRLGAASATLASQVMFAMRSAVQDLQMWVWIAMAMEFVSLASVLVHQDGEEQAKAPSV